MEELKSKLNQYEEQIQKQIDDLYKEYDKKQESLYKDIKNVDATTSEILAELQMISAKIEALEDTIDTFGNIFNKEEEEEVKRKLMEFYSDWDEDSASYCVFDTEIGKAWESYASPEEAERRAKERNELELRRLQEV